MNNYLNLLKNNFELVNDIAYKITRFDYLSTCIFKFITYNSEISELFVTKALEVCDAVTASKTYEYCDSSNKNYEWFLIMCNMPFFSDKLDWGCSIRKAWWNIHEDEKFEIDSYELEIKLDESQWNLFIDAMNRFMKGE